MAAEPLTEPMRPKQKGRREAGLSLFRFDGSRSSVLRDDRTTPTIVDADGDEIDVLTDALVEHQAGRADSGDSAVAREGVGAVAHEHMIVFDSCRPVRGEAVL